MHHVILGNGILALTTAFRLASRGEDKVTIIGKPAREGSATLAAAAMLNSYAEIEVGSLKHEIDQYRFEMSRKATEMWPAFDAAISDAGGAVVSALGNSFGNGSYIVNNTAADDLDDENFDAIIAALQEFGEPHELVNPRDIPNYMPEQHYRATRAAFIPNEGWFNPRHVIAKLDKVLATFKQVQVLEANVEKILASNGSISGVQLDDGRTITGDKYLLATGASSTDLLNKSDIGIAMQRVFYGVGTSIEIRSPDYPHKNCIRTPNRGLACGVYSAPYYQGPNEKNDHILIGASNFISPWPYSYSRLTSVESLMKAAMEQINANFYRADLIRVNVGWRPTSQDTYPLLGQSSISNLVIATGTKRDGFHLSPLVSEMMADLMQGKLIDKRMDVFAPERKLLNTMTRGQAVEKAARHMMSAAYQHGYTPSKSRMNAQVMQMYRDQVNKLHDEVGIYDWGMPPEMLDMYRYGHAKP